MSHRLFICCCKGFFRDENRRGESKRIATRCVLGIAVIREDECMLADGPQRVLTRDELYQLLDIDRRATPTEVKRAYRNKSLQMHPDKLSQRGQEVTDEDRANFQKMKGAYDVLSDPQKRELYDQLGETGMLMMEDPFAAKDNMMKNFLRMGTRDRLRLVIFVLLFVGAVLLWPILFCVKVDGELSSSWVALWTPLWIYDALGLWYFLYLVSLGEIKPPEGMEEGWKDPYPWPLRVLALFKWILIILFQIFLTLKLDDDITWSYAAVGSPLLAWMMLQLCGHLYDASQPIPKERTDETMLSEEEGEVPPDAEKREQAIAKRSEARSAAVKDCVWLIQLGFLIIQLDDVVDWNWWVVFLPTWMVLLGQLLGYGRDVALARNLVAGTEDKEEEDLTQEERARLMAASQLTVHAITSCCCWTFTFVTVVLAVNAIAGADYSTFVIFIPQFIIAGMAVCCMTCVICCLRDLPEDEEGIPDPEHGGATTAPHHAQPSYNTYDTYNPPNVPAGGTDKGAGGGSASGTVIAMPPPAAAAAPSTGSPPEPPAPVRRVPESTPAPENDPDGGID